MVFGCLGSIGFLVYCLLDGIFSINCHPWLHRPSQITWGKWVGNENVHCSCDTWRGHVQSQAFGNNQCPQILGQRLMEECLICPYRDRSYHRRCPFLAWFALRDERICLACCQFQLGFQGPSTLVGESTRIFKLVPMRIHICQGRNFIH